MSQKYSVVIGDSINLKLRQLVDVKKVSSV